MSVVRHKETEMPDINKVYFHKSLGTGGTAHRAGPHREAQGPSEGRRPGENVGKSLLCHPHGNELERQHKGI